MTGNLNPMQGRLTAKQEKFCREYASSGNAVKSYLSAYSKGNSYSAAGSEASKLLKNPRIRARLKELYETQNAEKIMQAEEIQTTLTEIARTGSIKDRLKAIDILCKMGGLYISKQELEITNAVPIVIKDNI